MKKYQIIYADPPWNVKKIIRKVRPNQIEMDYPVMTVDDIKALPVGELADTDSVLFLWTIQKYIRESFDVMESWGFKYHVMITWDKQNGMCLAGFHRRTEFLLFGYKGKLEIYPHRKAIPTLVQCKTDRHSKKPQIFRDLIGVFGDKKIELFARQKTEGWDVWGNEVESDIDL